MKRRKSDLITLTRDELDAMMETEMHERLSLNRHKRLHQHKLYNFLNEDYNSEDDYSSEDYNSEDDYNLEGYTSEDYSSEDDYTSEDYTSEDTELYDKCHTAKKITPTNIDRKLMCLIDIYRNEIEDDPDDYGISRNIYHYLRNNHGYGYNRFNKKVELYNQLKEIIKENL